VLAILALLLAVQACSFTRAADAGLEGPYGSNANLTRLPDGTVVPLLSLCSTHPRQPRRTNTNRPIAAQTLKTPQISFPIWSSCVG
jgi:hypothetical protein